MIANTQLFSDFSREVEKMKINLVATNNTFYRDTQILMKQVMQLKIDLDLRNRDFDKKLNDLKKLVLVMTATKVN